MARRFLWICLLFAWLGCSDEGDENPSRSPYLDRLPSQLVADALSDTPSPEYLAVRGRLVQKVAKDRRVYTQTFAISAGRGRALVEDTQIAVGRRQAARTLGVQLDPVKEQDASAAELTLAVLLAEMQKRVAGASTCEALGAKGEDCALVLLILEVKRCEAGAVTIDAGTPDTGLLDGSPPDIAPDASDVPSDGGAPELAALSPNSIPSGGAVTLAVSGSGFAAGAVVYLDGAPLETTFQAPNTLSAVVPATASPVASDLVVYVENAPGESSTRSNTLYLRVQPAPGAPVIHDYSPDNGVAGDKILIIGSYLEGAGLTVRDASGATLATGALGTLSWPNVGSAQSLEVTLSDSVRTGPLTVATELGQFRGKVFNVGQNLAKLPGVVITYSSEYNTSQWSHVSGSDNDLRTSFFTAVGDCASLASCTIKPWYRISFPTAQTVQRIAMRGNREYASGYDFVRGTFTLFGASDAVLWSQSYGLPEPDRDLDIVLPTPIGGVFGVRFDGTEDQSSEPGFAELEVFAP